MVQAICVFVGKKLVNFLALIFLLVKDPGNKSHSLSKISAGLDLVKEYM